MFNISSFLSKLKRNINAIELNKEEVIEVIKKNTNIQLRLEDVEIKNNAIFIKSNGAVKNKIFIFKEKILEEIRQKTTVKIVDIR